MRAGRRRRPARTRAQRRRALGWGGTRRTHCSCLGTPRTHRRRPRTPRGIDSAPCSGRSRLGRCPRTRASPGTHAARTPPPGTSRRTHTRRSTGCTRRGASSCTGTWPGRSRGRGQARSEQSGPAQPGSQEHWSPRHVPWQEQAEGHASSGSEQDAPVQPTSQEHSGLGESAYTCVCVCVCVCCVVCEAGRAGRVRGHGDGENEQGHPGGESRTSQSPCSEHASGHSTA